MLIDQLGCFSILPATDLVPGDIVEVSGKLDIIWALGFWILKILHYLVSKWDKCFFLECIVGCQIPADMRMVEMLSDHLRVDQAILTGNFSIYLYVW